MHPTERREWYTGDMPTVQDIADKAQPVFKKYGIKRARLFGSYARNEARPDSDVDLLVEFGPTSMGLFAYMEFRESLEKELGMDVDVVTEETMNEFMRPYIMKDVKPLYEK